jgi:ABC-type branched-subunit amino acid transport system substrate-binding protein
MKFIRLYALLCILLAVSSCLNAPKPARTYDNSKPVYDQQSMGQIPTPDGKMQMQVGEINAPHKIALLVPLSGRAQKIGKAISDAAQMALFESGNTEFQIIPLNTGDTPDMAELAAKDAVAQGAEVIIGPVFADAVSAVAPIAREHGIKVFSFSNNKSVAGNGVYLLGLMPEQQVERVVNFAANKKVKGFSAVLPDNLFGNQVADIVRKQTSWYGSSIRKLHFYSSAQPNFSGAADAIDAALKERNIIPNRMSEALVIPETGYNLTQIVKALENKGINTNTIRLLGTALWDNRDVLSNRTLENAWYVAPAFEKYDPFIERFGAAFGYESEDVFAISALGYDAVNLAMELSNSDYATSEIHRQSGFSGVRGIYRFDAKGISQRGYAVYEIRDGSAHVIDAAPGRF